MYNTFQTIEIVALNADRLRRGLGKQTFPKHCALLMILKEEYIVVLLAVTCITNAH